MSSLYTVTAVTAVQYFTVCNIYISKMLLQVQNKLRQYIHGRLLWPLQWRYYMGRMSTGLIWQTVSTSSKETERLAEQLGNRLRGGEVIELVSDLGGGKTTFVRGLARGLGSSNKVSSPSFTLSNTYKAENLTIYHFDFYRLSEPGIMKDELAECIADTQVITVVEWADIVEDVLPPERLAIRLKTTGENDREISLQYTEKLNYLIEAIT